jgi:hypothetical protein
VALLLHDLGPVMTFRLASPIAALIGGNGSAKVARSTQAVPSSSASTVNDFARFVRPMLC